MILVTFDKDWNIKDVIFNINAIGGPVQRKTHQDYKKLNVNTDDKGWFDIEQPYSYSVYTKEHFKSAVKSSLSLTFYMDNNNIKL